MSTELGTADGRGLRRINAALFTPAGAVRPELSEQAVANLLKMFNAMRATMGLRPLELPA